MQTLSEYLLKRYYKLLALVPKPVKAVVLLYPITDATEARDNEEDEIIARDGQPEIDSTVFWMKQTVGNTPALRNHANDYSYRLETLVARWDYYMH